MLGYSAINTAHSALSSVLTLKDGVKFGEYSLVVRCMKGIFELKPALLKYTEIWDVNIVLGYLKTFVSVSSLFFKELSTLNLTMLLCLTTGHRGQTIHKMDVRYRITICDKLKQTKPGRHLEPTDLFAYPNDKSLCVVELLKNIYIAQNS